MNNEFRLRPGLNHLPSLTWARNLKQPLGLLLLTLNSLSDSGDMVDTFEDGTKLKVPWDYPTFTNQGLRFASKIAFNCLAYVALTVRSIQLVLGSISEELTEDCRNICPEKLEEYQIEQCLDRSLSLPYQGRIFLQKWLTHMTQIVSAESSWDNDHHYVNFWQKLELSENDRILSLKNYLSEFFFSEWKNSETSKT